MQERRTERKSSKLGITCILLFILAVLLPVLSFVTYYLENKPMDQISISESYIESDLLTISTEPRPEHTLEPGENTISFLLKSLPGEMKDPLEDIVYNATLSMNGVVLWCHKGILYSDEIRDEVEFDNLESGTYIVTVNITEPQQLTLHGEFTVISDDETVTDGIAADEDI